MGKLLRQVSRSFYLSLRFLPGKIRPQIGLAYLLARITDTIADTQLVSVERRLDTLRGMRTAILAAADGGRAFPPDLAELAAVQTAPAGQGSPAERRLLQCSGQALEALRGFPGDDRRRIRQVLATLTGAQEMDLVRFGDENRGPVRALESETELDEYTYNIAGCVGEFWTKMCRAHLFPDAALDLGSLLTSGVRFGKGLQLVNILRDLPRDLRQGRCYIPSGSLARYGLSPQALLNSAVMNQFRPLYEHYLQEAEEHLAAGWAYTNSLPCGQLRLRLACAWPILIGAKTIARLRTGNVLDGSRRIKLSRSEVRHLIVRSMLCYGRSSAWDRLFDRARSPSEN